MAAATALSIAAPDAPKKAPRSSAVTVTGCLDQHGETYVLTGDRELRVKYTLRGAGFSDDNFARYLGHRVEVRGNAEEGNVIRVRDIKTLSESCQPASPSR